MQIGLFARMTALCLLGTPLIASEFHPQKPFAGEVDLPKPGQMLITPLFVYSAFQSYYQGREEVDISRGDLEYDVEYYGGVLTLEYGLKPNWAIHLTFGFVDEATRCFNAPGEVEKTSGLMDTQFGIRYQVLHDSLGTNWIPDLTLRVNGMFRGTYEETFPFAPGYGETGIEPGFLVRKAAWPNGGIYASAFYRHMMSYAPDSVLLSAGLFQRWRQFSLYAGYRQQQAMSGYDVVPETDTADPYDVRYTNRVKETNYQAEWGGSYLKKNGVLLQVYMSTNFDGRNAGEKLTYNGAITIPFQLTKR